MLLNHMGRERALEGIQAFFKTYHGNPDHPVLQDFLEVMRKFAPDRKSFDAFARQWFFEVNLPEYRLQDPQKTREGDSWRVAVRIENAGTGAPPVEIAATRGRRFDKTGKEAPEYRDARVTETLGKGDSRELVIPCSFEPELIVVDPDAKVLQLGRKSALLKL
jgi:hypothetical protein